MCLKHCNKHDRAYEDPDGCPKCKTERDLPDRVCPLMVIAQATIPFTFPDRDGVFAGNFSVDCIRSRCQIWDDDRLDCGLKG
jgi:hypothetical protein